MMKVAVLGSTGMAGHVVAQHLEECSYTVYRVSRSEKNTEKSAKIDITDFERLGAWLDNAKVNIVINCIGLLQKACGERHDLAVLINSYFPHWLEQRYLGTETKIIHLSTDCVFSGKRGNYLEDDLPDGRTMYDRTKALGEIQNTKDLTLRMSIIGPDIDPAGTGLFNWFMKQVGTIQGYRGAIWNGVTTVELARAIDAAICQNLSGLYQLVPLEPIDKYSLLELFQRSFHKEKLTIEGVDGVCVNKSLRNTRTDFSFEVSPYADQIEDMVRWIRTHSEMYPHYFSL